jgi:hypothetical protein
MYAFVVGCARSGTSILGELIGAHPGVRYLFEAHTVWELGGDGEEGSHRLTERHATADVAARIRAWFEEQRGGRGLVVEKNPRNVLRIPYVAAIFPEARFVHIVRDGRDVACSMVPGCGGAEWRHLKPPSWREHFRERTGAVRCALAWREAVETGLADLEGRDHLQVRYEDLVSAPAEVAQRLLGFLRLPPSPEVEAFCGRITDDTRGSYHAKGQDHWFRGDHGVRVGRWRENLGEAERDEVCRIAGPLLRRLGYPEEGEG